MDNTVIRLIFGGAFVSGATTGLPVSLNPHFPVGTGCSLVITRVQ
jgi:hypothetical protein